MELLPDTRVGPGRVRAVGGSSGRERWQRNAAARGERAHQHLPAFAGLRRTADDVIDRNKDVLAPVRAVLEHVQTRKVAASNGHARQVGRHQRDSDAGIFFSPEQMIGIGQLEREAQHGRDRAERDVALVPVQPDAGDFLALERALADHAGVDHGGSIGAGFRRGQAEAGDFTAFGQPRQPVVALLVGAEHHQQFAGSERVRHHGGDGGGD